MLMLHNSINVEVILTILLLWFLNNITNYPMTTRIALALTTRKPATTYYQIHISESSETFRSMNFHFLSFLKCSEVWFSDFRPFWNVQKRVSCVNDYIKLGKSTLSMRRKALYLLYKAFQSTKEQNNTQTYCVFIVFLQCLRTQRKHFFHLHRKNQ